MKFDKFSVRISDCIAGWDDEGRWWITFGRLNLLPVKH